MKREDIEEVAGLGKPIVVGMKNGFGYTCNVLNYGDDSFRARDKYGKLVVLQYESVESVAEQ